MRHITLWSFCFEDASELHKLLIGSTSLKRLVLRRISFKTVDRAKRSLEASYIGSASVRVVLDSLHMRSLDTAHFQAIMNSFTVVNITRLSCLDLDLRDTPTRSLLALNASSVQHLKLRIPSAHFSCWRGHVNVSQSAVPRPRGDFPQQVSAHTRPTRPPDAPTYGARRGDQAVVPWAVERARPAARRAASPCGGACVAGDPTARGGPAARVDAGGRGPRCVAPRAAAAEAFQCDTMDRATGRCAVAARVDACARGAELGAECTRPPRRARRL
ncbi:hypothetical protein DFH09DRAFT_1360327, partial [Mycena vulgaris]